MIVLFAAVMVVRLPLRENEACPAATRSPTGLAMPPDWNSPTADPAVTASIAPRTITCLPPGLPPGESRPPGEGTRLSGRGTASLRVVSLFFICNRPLTDSRLDRVWARFRRATAREGSPAPPRSGVPSSDHISPRVQPGTLQFLQ